MSFVNFLNFTEILESRNRETETTHNIFRDCRVQFFFRQPLSMLLYTLTIMQNTSWSFHGIQEKVLQITSIYYVIEKHNS